MCAQVLLDLLLQLVQLLDVARLGELRQLLQVDDADLRRLGGLFQLLQQPVDRLQLFLDLQRLRARVSGVRPVNVVLAGQLVDLVLVAQPVDELHQLRGRTATRSSPA